MVQLLTVRAVLCCAVQVVSSDLRGCAITALALGRNKHQDAVLLAGDRDGKIGVWNLSLFRSQLSSLPLELRCSARHSLHDPSVVSVDAHLPSCTGEDTSAQRLL